MLTPVCQSILIMSVAVVMSQLSPIAFMVTPNHHPTALTTIVMLLSFVRVCPCVNLMQYNTLIHRTPDNLVKSPTYYMHTRGSAVKQGYIYMCQLVYH